MTHWVAVAEVGSVYWVPCDCVYVCVYVCDLTSVMSVSVSPG
jgi:hypothetical protein